MTHTIDGEITELERQATNLSQAIAEGGQLAPLLDRLNAVNGALTDARRRRAGADQQAATADRCPSRDEIASRLDSLLLTVAASSYEFTALMRGLFVEFVVQPVQALDRPTVHPVGKLRWRMPPESDNESAANTGDAADHTLVLNLFDPPLHIRHVDDCLQQRRLNPRLNYKRIGQALSVSGMTVKRAFDYARRMAAAGMAEPYRELHERPARASRWK